MDFRFQDSIRVEEVIKYERFKKDTANNKLDSIDREED